MFLVEFGIRIDEISPVKVPAFYCRYDYLGCCQVSCYRYVVVVAVAYESVVVHIEFISCIMEVDDCVNFIEVDS